ncbi:MAG: TetR/AcrR family transcriptional regulator [Anaerolineae bacterium]|nr:TetR/AcrR family transcriptional regulator [Anaerolineae bacterium]
MSRGRYQQKQWEQRQSAILDALTTLSAEHGFANVTMDDLADEVGISKATLYQHFDSKDDMLVHMIAWHAGQFLDWLAGTVEQPPVERLCAAMRYLMEGQITPLRGLIHTGRDNVLPAFHENDQFVEQHTHTLETLGAIIQQGQEQGAIRRDLAPSVIISAMWALSNVSMSAYVPLDCVQRPASDGDYVNQMIALFERSIQPAS